VTTDLEYLPAIKSELKEFAVVAACPWLSMHSIAREVDAILVNAPAFGGWYLLQGKAGAISCTTDIHALLFGGLSRRQGERCEIGVARMECSCTHDQ
jgi:hypothetical protein